MIAVELSGWGLWMRKPGDGLKVVLRSWRRAILMFLDRISSLKSCWVWSWRLWVEDLMVDPVLYWRILVVVVGVVMVAGGWGGC